MSSCKHSQALPFTHSQDRTSYLSTEFEGLLMSGPTGKTLNALNATRDAWAVGEARGRRATSSTV